MKAKDYLIVATLCLVIVWVFSPGGKHNPLKEERPILAAIVKIAKTAGWLFLLVEEPPHPEEVDESFRELPRDIVNTYPPREVDGEGTPQLDHGSGW